LNSYRFALIRSSIMLRQAQKIGELWAPRSARDVPKTYSALSALRCRTTCGVDRSRPCPFLSGRQKTDMACWQTQGMITYKLTSLAVEDLSEIRSYIARDNLEAANAVEKAIYRACAFLAHAPLAGRLRPDLTPFASAFLVLSSLTAITSSSMILQPNRCRSSGCSTEHETSQHCCPDSASPL